MGASVTWEQRDNAYISHVKFWPDEQRLVHDQSGQVLGVIVGNIIVTNEHYTGLATSKKLEEKVGGTIRPIQLVKSHAPFPMTRKPEIPPGQTQISLWATIKRPSGVGTEAPDVAVTYKNHIHIENRSKQWNLLCATTVEGEGKSRWRQASSVIFVIFDLTFKDIAKLINLAL